MNVVKNAWISQNFKKCTYSISHLKCTEMTFYRKKNSKRNFPRRGIEPRSPACQVWMLTTILDKAHYMDVISGFYTYQVHTKADAYI